MRPPCSTPNRSHLGIIVAPHSEDQALSRFVAGGVINTMDRIIICTSGLQGLLAYAETET